MQIRVFDNNTTTSQAIASQAKWQIESMRQLSHEELDAPDAHEKWVEELQVATPVMDYDNSERSISEDKASDGIQVTIRVPVTGTHHLLNSKPSNHPTSEPDATYEDHSLLGNQGAGVIFVHRAPSAETGVFKKWREEQYALMDAWLGGLDRDVKAWNMSIGALVDRELSARRAKLASIDSFDLDA